MDTQEKQLDMFETFGAFSGAPANLQQALSALARVREEIRLGDWDFDRLLSVKEKYEKTAKRYRGVTSFKFRANKFEALEARSVLTFLRTWVTRREALEARQQELEFLIKGMS